MFVQGDSFIHRMDKMRAKQVDALGDVRHNVLQIEACVGARHDDLAQLDVAGRTPREHPRRARAGESGHRAAADSPRRFGVAGAVLNHAAAIRRARENFVARAETVQDFEAEQRDMRRLEDVATEIHHDVRRRIRPRGGRLGETGKEIGRKLQTRQHLHRAGHFFEAGLAGGAPFARLAPLVEPQAGRRQHETRINALIAGRETTTGAGARVGPAGASA